MRYLAQLNETIVASVVAPTTESKDLFYQKSPKFCLVLEILKLGDTFM